MNLSTRHSLKWHAIKLKRLKTEHTGERKYRGVPYDIYIRSSLKNVPALCQYIFLIVKVEIFGKTRSVSLEEFKLNIDTKLFYTLDLAEHYIYLSQNQDSFFDFH